MNLKEKEPLLPDSQMLEKQWHRYLEAVKKHDVREPRGLQRCFSELGVNHYYHRLLYTALLAHDLIVPLFDRARHARSFRAVTKSIGQAEEALHERFPQPPDTCPECGKAGIVRFVGYPGPILLAAERLGYAGSSGCIGGVGSSGDRARMCVSCRHCWVSDVPYDLKIFEYLKSLYPEKINPPVTNADARIRFSGLQSLGKCPQCGGDIFAYDQYYVCQNTVLYSYPCNFRVGMNIFKNKVSVKDVKELLCTGRTRMMNGFISSRTGRRFSARLKVSTDGRLTLDYDEATKARIKKRTAGKTLK